MVSASITGHFNTALGVANLINLTSGIQNVVIGNAALRVTSGSNNIALGLNSGVNYTSSENSNICIASQGVTSESNVIRIGTQGTLLGEQNKAFMAGITGLTVAASSPVGMASTGQFSDLGFGTATQVLTSNGPGVSPTWQAAGGGGATKSLSVVLNSASSSFASGSGPNTIVYDTVLVDTNSGYSSGVYTVPAGGTGNWFISCCFLAGTAVSFTVCDLFLNKNSGTYILHLTPDATADGVINVNGSGSGLFPLVAGDTLQWQVVATTTGATTYSMTGASNGFFNIFSAFKLA